jgi:hypothetical protein
MGTVTFFFSLYFLVRAWAVEPGILPTVDTEEARSDGRLVKKISLDGKLYDLSAFRAKFCKELGVTIERFDHFCPWTGNGVGVRNYFYFFMFLVFTIAHASFVGVTSFLNASSNVKSRHVLVAIGLYCIGIVSLVGSLLVYHIYIIGQNITTAEKIKNVYRGSNPYNEGIAKNWQSFYLQATNQPRVSYVWNGNDSTGWKTPYKHSAHIGDDDEDGDEEKQDLLKRFPSPTFAAL